jgi:hypothetical protein
LIGAIDGAVTGQIAGGQIGGRSIAFWQSGCISPLTHWQMHDAVAPWLPIARKRIAHGNVQIRRFTKAPKRRFAGDPTGKDGRPQAILRLSAVFPPPSAAVLLFPRAI